MAESEDLEQGPDLASTQLSGVTPLKLEITQNPEPHILHSTDPDTATGRHAWWSLTRPCGTRSVEPGYFFRVASFFIPVASVA